MSEQKTITTKKTTPQLGKLRYERDKDREMVKGIFRFYECPGSTLSFSFKAYKEDPVERYTLADGEIYTLPRGVARHLANSGWYPIHAYAQDDKGNSIAKMQKKVFRYGFQSLEFIDLEDISSNHQEQVVLAQPLR